MKRYQEYSTYLDSLVQNVFLQQIDSNLEKSVKKALDGQPAEKLRQLVPINQIRDSGAFFTGSALAQNVLRLFLKTINSNSVIYDPACGAGDLLLACASRLSMKQTLAETIGEWGARLMGRDLHSEFISATKSRLALSAFSLSNYEHGEIKTLEDIFPGIQTGCAFNGDVSFRYVTHIVTNPPFTDILVPENCSWWGRGKVNSAAVFVVHCINNAMEGTRLVAILPDVLRSGPMYQKWRDYIISKTNIINVHLHGRFDNSADIDVFSIELIIGERNNLTKVHWDYPPNENHKVLSDDFEIRIGPVVDFRHRHEGNSYSFIQVNNLPPWQVVKQIHEKRQFTGRVFGSPFVAVRRNSRPDDSYRAVGTIIFSDEPVAVENHLIVFIPKDGSLETCKKLLDNLKNSKTKIWLDQRICCRHLTISAMKDLPWWE